MHSVEDDRAAIQARQKAVQATNLGLRLGLASSISRDLHSSTSNRPALNHPIAASTISSTFRGCDFDPDVSASDKIAASARGGHIGFTFPAAPSDNDTADTAQENDEHYDSRTDPDSSQLSKVVGSVIEPREKRERWHCFACGFVFPRDSTIYAPPTRAATASTTSVSQPGAGFDPTLFEPDGEPNCYFCRPCYAERYSLGECSECGGDILGTTRQDGAFVRVPTTGAMYHGRCYACVHCGVVAAPPPLGDGASVIIGMHNLPLCEACFEADPQAPRQSHPVQDRQSDAGDLSLELGKSEGARPKRKDAKSKAMDELRQRLHLSPMKQTPHQASAASTRHGDIAPSGEETTPRLHTKSFPRSESTPEGWPPSSSACAKPRTFARSSPRVRDIAAAFETRSPMPTFRQTRSTDTGVQDARTRIRSTPLSTSSGIQANPSFVPSEPITGQCSPSPQTPQALRSSSVRPTFDAPLKTFPKTESSPANGKTPDVAASPPISQGQAAKYQSNEGSGHVDDSGSSEPYVLEPHAPSNASVPSSLDEAQSAPKCARCGESPFLGPQQGSQESAMVSIPGGMVLHAECFSCTVCHRIIDGTRPFVRAEDSKSQGEASEPLAFAHPRCVPLMPVQQQRHSEVPRSTATTEHSLPRDHATFQRTPKPAHPSPELHASGQSARPIRGLAVDPPLAQSKPDLLARQHTHNASQPSEQRARFTTDDASSARHAYLPGKPKAADGKAPPPTRHAQHVNPAAGLFALRPVPALSPSGKANVSVPAATSRRGGYGGMTPCPLCQGLLTSIEGVPGPRGTRWHKGCLVCQGKLRTGKPCSKRLDSGAKVDQEGRVLCRECFDAEARRGARTPSLAGRAGMPLA